MQSSHDPVDVLVMRSADKCQIPEETVIAIHRRLSLKRFLIEQRAEEAVVGCDARKNCWIDASDFVTVFPRVHLKEGVKLVCLLSSDRHQRRSRMFVVKTVDVLAAIPAALANADLDEIPSGLPDWIDCDAERYLVCSDKLIACFEMALCLRWLNGVLDTADEASWSQVKVLASAHRESIALLRDESHSAARPDWLPVVWFQIPIEHPLVQDSKLLNPTEDAERLRVVEFYGYSQGVKESLTRYRDFFLDGRRIHSASEVVAGRSLV